jgi:hypothetical protein
MAAAIAEIMRRKDSPFINSPCRFSNAPPTQRLALYPSYLHQTGLKCERASDCSLLSGSFRRIDGDALLSVAMIRVATAC